jgi:hypothetical protein
MFEHPDDRSHHHLAPVLNRQLSLEWYPLTRSSFLRIAGLVEVEHAIPDAAGGDVGSGVM